MKQDIARVRVSKVLTGSTLEKVQSIQAFLSMTTEQEAWDYLARRGIEAVNQQLETQKMMSKMTPEALVRAMQEQGLIEEGLKANE